MARSLLGGLAHVGAGYLRGRTEEEQRREGLRRQALLDAMSVAQARSALQTAGLQRQYLGRQIEGYMAPGDLTRLQHGLAMQRQQTGWDREEALRTEGLEAARRMTLAQLRQRLGPTPPHAQAPSVVLEGYAPEAPARELLEAPVRLPPSGSDTLTARPHGVAALPEAGTRTGAPRMTLPRGLEGSPWQAQQRAAGVEVTPWEERSAEDLLALYGELEGPVRYDPGLRGYVPGGALPSARQEEMLDIDVAGARLGLEQAGVNLDQARAQLDGVKLGNERAALLLQDLPDDIDHRQIMRVLDEHTAEVTIRAQELANAVAEATNPLQIQQAQVDLEAAQLKHDEALLRNKAFKDMLESDDAEVRRRAMDTLLGIQYYVSDVTPSKARVDEMLEQLRTEQARLHSDRRVTVDYSGIPTTRESHATIEHRSSGTAAAPAEGDEDPFDGSSPRSRGVGSLNLW